MTYFNVCAWIMFIHAFYVMSSHKATEIFCFVHTMQYIYEEDNKSALERLGRQATFKFRALWSVRDGKGLKHSLFQNVVLNINYHLPWQHYVMTCETQITVHPVKNPGDMKQEKLEKKMCMSGSQVINCVRVRV